MRTPLAVLAALSGLLATPAAATSTPLPPGALADAARRAGIEIGAALEGDLAAWRLAIASGEFTSATPENSLKWAPLAPGSGGYDFTHADTTVDFAEQAGLRIRGHAVFWDRLNGTPDWVRAEVAAAADPAAHLTGLMQTHATTVVGRYAGRIQQWDVVNEPLGIGSAVLDPQSLYTQTLGESYIDIAFAAAHAADPNALLFLNETLTESPVVFDGLIALAERLLGRGVPLDGIGLQSHYFVGAPDRDALVSRMQQIEALGLLVEVTELDLPIGIFAGDPDPLAAQARAFADVVSACLAVAACTGVTTWGIDDGDTWLDEFAATANLAPNRPLLFDENGLPKPAYDAVVAELASVPEPGTGALVLAGLVAAAGLRRARTERSAY